MLEVIIKEFDNRLIIKQVKNNFYIQFLVASGIIFILSLFLDVNKYYSLFYGFFIGFFPHVFFAVLNFSILNDDGKYSKQILTLFYVGEAIKFILTISLFLLALNQLHLLPMYIFAGYGLGLIIRFITSIIL